MHRCVLSLDLNTVDVFWKLVSDAEKLVHAFMILRLDALLAGCPASSINKL